MPRDFLRPFFLAFLLFVTAALSAQATGDVTKPWTYWWWMGNAVEKDEIVRELDQFAESGLGGVHIIPIYGAKGYEDNFIDFLSEEWMEIVAFTEREAEARGLGMDLTLGTGWPFGGPWVKPADVAMQGQLIEIPLIDARQVTVDPERIIRENDLTAVLAAFITNGERNIDLREHLRGEPVVVDLPAGDWEYRAFGMKPTRQQVKRAAPGGEGPVIDYFSRQAVANYLEHFDSVFAYTDYPVTPRAIYHDSYEAYGADITRAFVDSFQAFNGYSLIEYTPLDPGDFTSDDSLLVHDIRSTLDRLLYGGFGREWTAFARHRGAGSRYQAHGSPGNILDLYGLASIPETESFGCSQFPIPGLECDPDYNEENFGRPSALMMRFASSPAHLMGKPLVSSETGTWLGNHFKVSLRQVKPQVDQLLASGINHIFWHGTAYSPERAGYPGWRFYASTNFGPDAHFHDEFGELNRYVQRCQEQLQAARPDNDVLLYFPLHDLWVKRPYPVAIQLDVHHYDAWFGATPFGALAGALEAAGVAFDYVSDRQLAELRVDTAGRVGYPGGGSYRTVVVPAMDYIPRATLEQMRRLAAAGIRIVFDGKVPNNFAEMEYYQNEETPRVMLLRGRAAGKLLVTADPVAVLDTLGVRREGLKEAGLDFLRKRTTGGTRYFITNLGAAAVSESLRLNADYAYVKVTDPLTGRADYLETRDTFRLNVAPGQSYLLDAVTERPSVPRRGPATFVGAQPLPGPWAVSFAPGRGPAPADTLTVNRLTSWTDWDVDSLGYYSGKATYRTTFALDTGGARARSYRIAFDTIRESAEVILNGVSQGTLWAFPNELELRPEDLRKDNVLEVVVQNVSANYLRHYDREHPEWKNFYDINFVDITYRPFRAEEWPAVPAGLIGGVTVRSYR